MRCDVLLVFIVCVCVSCFSRGLRLALWLGTWVVFAVCFWVTDCIWWLGALGWVFYFVCFVGRLFDGRFRLQFVLFLICVMV